MATPISTITGVSSRDWGLLRSLDATTTRAFVVKVHVQPAADGLGFISSIDAWGSRLLGFGADVQAAEQRALDMFRAAVDAWIVDGTLDRQIGDVTTHVVEFPMAELANIIRRLSTTPPADDHWAQLAQAA